MNSFQIIILSFFMSITVMSVSAQNNDSIKINNFSIEKNAQGDSVSLRFHLMIAPGITKANDELLLTPILIDIKGNHSFAFPVIRVNGKIREKIVRRQKVLHSSKAEKDLIYTVSNRQWNTITCSTPMLANQLWIWQAKLVLRRQLGNCCMKKELDMVELFTWNRTDGYSIVKPEIKNKVEIPEMLPQKATEYTLYPGISAEDCSKPAYDSSAEMKKNNHLEVFISRAAAKLQATYVNVDALILKDSESNTLGKLLTPTFTVRNLPVQSYIFLHNHVDGFLTPFYTMTNTSSTFADFAKYYDEVNEPNLDLKASADGEAIESIYLPENSNQTPVRGNTTYVLVKGVFAPAANVMINAVEVKNDGGNLSIENKLDGTDYTTGGKDVPPYFIVPEWENQIYTAPADFSGNLANYGLGMILKTYLNKAGKQKWLNAVDEGSAVDEGDIENSVSVYYGSSFSTSEGIYSVVTIKKYSHPKNALPGYKESIEGTIRIFQYTGGTCYYRVNVEDNMDGKTEANNLFYSVMRNRFYNVNISKITSIGYPDDEDVTVDPTDPINQKTYMQAHITVEPWTKVEQDAELGM